jgi:hypothetical protein
MRGKTEAIKEPALGIRQRPPKGFFVGRRRLSIGTCGQTDAADIGDGRAGLKILADEK